MEDEDRNRKTEIVEIADFFIEYRWLPAQPPSGQSPGRLAIDSLQDGGPWDILGLWSIAGGFCFLIINSPCLLKSPLCDI